MNYKGIDYLRKKLALVRIRVLERYKFYEMKDTTLDRGITIPAHLRSQYRATLGWCSKAVDSIADRMIFREFGNDNFEINEIFNSNNPDVLFDSAILSALISSCSFIYISDDENGEPQLQVIDGANATGIIDPITGLLLEGYAVLERDEHGQPIHEAYFIKGQTDYIRNGEKNIRTNNAPFPLLVPIINRPDAIRPFGHSRISRACMYYQKYAKRTLERSDISAEFYSVPQRYVVGLSQDAERLDTWKATITSMLNFTRDNEGNMPTLGQFPQQTMTPYQEQLKTIASVFAGETGLTLDDLGFATGNPASAEAIKSAHEQLRATARKAQRSFGRGFLNAGYIAACLRDNKQYERSVFYKTKAKWEPLFEPDSAMLSSIGDGAIKLNQAIPNYFDKDNIRDLTGIKPSEE